jgi:hypothetical protein
MKKIILGVLIGFGLATTLVMAEQATEQHRGMIGGMIQRMMGEQKPVAPKERRIEQIAQPWADIVFGLVWVEFGFQRFGREI